MSKVPDGASDLILGGPNTKLVAVPKVARCFPLFVLVMVTAVTLPGCGSDGDSLVVYAGRNENLIGPLLNDFAADSGVDITVRYGETSELLPALLEEGKENARADVFISQDAGALAVLADRGFLATLPEATLVLVEERFRDPGGRWVGLTGRARVIAYNTDAVDASELPASVLDVVAPRWKDKVGFPPTNASFVAFVSALREQVGDDRTRTFLEGLAANNAKEYDSNVLVLQAVADGEVDLGLVNHYYLYNERKERPDDSVPVENHFPGQAPGGEGTFVNVSGVAVGAGEGRTPHASAQELVDFLLGEKAQEFFVEETFEYPLRTGTPGPVGVPPLDKLRAIDVPLADLGEDLEGTQRLLADLGLT